MQLVTVFRSFSPAEAQLIRSRLDAAGIPAEVVNELAALSLDGYSMAAGGIRVQVPDNYAAEATALIDSANESTDEPAPE
jgi:hypothetical protein